jgi:hypothetical protein
MKKNLLKVMKDKTLNVVRVEKNEFELDNGDIYPIPFDVNDDISIEEFQKIINSSKDIVIKILEQYNE